MSKQRNLSLAEFLETGYLHALHETICATLKEEAEDDGHIFDLKDPYWKDRFYFMEINEIKQQFSKYGIHL